MDRLAAEKRLDSYESLHVFQLLRTRPALLQLLALPPGYLCILDRGEIKAVVDPDNNDAWNVAPGLMAVGLSRRAVSATDSCSGCRSSRAARCCDDSTGGRYRTERS